ncbi:hypothetical protein ACTHGU_20090 [Chitinophagaceae bacterium MMS25-I14]
MIRNLLTYLLLAATLVLPDVAHAQQRKKTTRKTEELPPVVPEDKKDDNTVNNTVLDAGDSRTYVPPPPTNFDFDAYKKRLAKMDSMQQAFGIFRMADSMASVVLAHYNDTCRHPDPVHKQLARQHYNRYHEEIVLQPYKGIWRVWYMFDEHLYHDATNTTYAIHKVPKAFPFHFVIVVDQKNHTTTVRKEVFDSAYKPQ